MAHCDFKLKIPSFIMNTFLPKATKGWLDNINKYYLKNEKNI